MFFYKRKTTSFLLQMHRSCSWPHFVFHLFCGRSSTSFLDLHYYALCYAFGLGDTICKSSSLKQHETSNNRPFWRFCRRISFLVANKLSYCQMVNSERYHENSCLYRNHFFITSSMPCIRKNLLQSILGAKNHSWSLY